MNKDTTQTIFSMLYQSRLKRVIWLYKASFQILFDKVTLFYLIPFVLFGLFMMKDYVLQHTNDAVYEALHRHSLSFSIAFAFLLLFSAGMSASTNPRYKLTSSDYLLLTHPINMEKIFRWNVQREQIKRLITFIGILSLATFFFDLFSLPTYGLMILTFAIVDLFTGLYQWKVFQKELGQKALLILIYNVSLLLLATGIFYLHDSVKSLLLLLYSIGMVAVFLCSVKWLQSKLLKTVKWEKTVWYGEDKTWNRLTVKLVTGTGFHISNRVWIPSGKQKKRTIPYRLTNILRQYWKGYFSKNKSFTITMITNTLAIFLLLHIQLPTLGFSYSVASLIILFLEINVFQERMNTVQFRVLPWSLQDYIKAFLRPAFLPIGFLLIAQFIFLIFLEDFKVVEVVFIVAGEWMYTFGFLLILLKHSFLSLNNNGQLLKLKQLFYMIFYIMIGYISVLYPYVNLLVIGGGILLLLNMRFQNREGS